MSVQIGSLFAGYGGLEMGIQAVLGGHVAWHSEIDQAASRVLARHWPGVPNLGDITAIDWTTVPRVDVLAGGFPCQDVSTAGRQAGLRPGTRSGLWSHFAYAIDQLRPALVVAENVRGLLSAGAHCDVEPCPWCVGDGEGEPALRALGAVLGDLADLGYDAAWTGLRAADVGAPHARFRVFVVAWPAADTDGIGPLRGGDARGWRDGSADDGGAPAYPGSARAGRDAGAVPRAATEGRRPGADVRATVDAGTDVDADPHGPGLAFGLGIRGDHGQGLAAALGDGRDGALADADRDGQPSIGRVDTLECDPDGCGGQDVAWGDYEPAIRRWERVLGRSAPAPTEVGGRGAARLSPAFVEWMLGLPAGWVTDTPGLTRNDMLRCLGNGVVPQQAAVAIRPLIPALERAA